MQLQPRYDGPPILVVDGVGDPSVPLLRQRRRFAALLQTLTDEQWATQSRCSEWTVQGVISHLLQTDQFWAISMTAGLRGEPTRFLATFDPVASPAQAVAGMITLTPAEVLARYLANLEAFEAVIASIADDQWDTVMAEAPPGHLSLGATALHALWDSWIHERDVAIPLGLTPVEEADEVEAILRYAVGLSPSFVSSVGTNKSGTLGIVTTEPSLSLVVHAADTVRVSDGTGDGPCLRGRAVDLIEALSYRAKLEHDLGEDDQWMLAGLAAVFDQV